MTDETRLDMECRIHALICGELDESKRLELLSLVAHDDRVRDVLRELVDDAQEVRAAFGYDRAESTLRASLSELKASLAADQSARGGSVLRFMSGLGWLVQVAAVLVMVVSISAAYVAIRNGRAVSDQLADVSRRLAEIDRVPAISLSAADRNRYEKLWEQVGEADGNTWVLVGTGGGELGSMTSAPPAAAVTASVLLVQYRMYDERNTCIYRRDLLVPDRSAIDERLSDAGIAAGHSVTLTLSRANDRVLAGVVLSEDGIRLGGVSGQASLAEGTVDEVGQFRLNDQRLRVFVRTQRLSGVQT